MNKKIMIVCLLLCLLLFGAFKDTASEDAMYLLTRGSSKSWLISQMLINDYIYKEPRDGNCMLNREAIFYSNGDYKIDTTCNQRQEFSALQKFKLINNSMVMGKDTFDLIYLSDDRFIIEFEYPVNILSSDPNIVSTSNSAKAQITYLVK